MPANTYQFLVTIHPLRAQGAPVSQTRGGTVPSLLRLTFTHKSWFTPACAALTTG
jgi:hypothetical protein